MYKIKKYDHDIIQGVYSSYKTDSSNIRKSKQYLLERYQVINGVKHGKCIQRYGPDTEIQYYIHGQLCGYQIKLEKSMELTRLISYIKRTRYYCKNGKKYGRYVVSYINIYSISQNVVDQSASQSLTDQSASQSTQRLPKSSVLYICHYQNDQLHGTYTRFFKFSNKMKYQANYQNGTLHGSCKYWNKKYNRYITFTYRNIITYLQL